MKNTIALVLAAGASSRMGRPKQLLPWKDTTLLGHTIKQLEEAGLDRIVLVLGAHEEEIRESVAGYQVEIQLNPHWKNGLGSSIAYGISSIQEKYTPGLVLIALADQPLITAAYYREMLNKFSQNPECIIATQYEKKVGVPALFPAVYLDQLSNLNKDSGASALLNDPQTPVIALNGEQITTDLDNYPDYLSLKKKHKA